MPSAKMARDRVLEVAEDLFYREGVRAVGIDTIIARSGVAKMSLYRSFASKDELIVAYLQERNLRFFERWDRAVGSDDDPPRLRLRRLVEATVNRVRNPDFRGCPFLNTSSEFPDSSHPTQAVVTAHRKEVRERLIKLCGALNPKAAEKLATQFIVLLDGIYSSAGRLNDQEASDILDAADALLDAQEPQPGRRAPRR